VSSYPRSALCTRFANFSAIGGTVDVILSDFEMGGSAYWYEFAHQAPQSLSPANMTTPMEALQRDPRWPALLQRLNRAGEPYNATFDDLADMPSWSGFSRPFTGDWRAWVWDIVVVDGMVAESLNASVFAPIRALFPGVAMSNFAHHHHTDGSRTVQGAPEASSWWPHAANSAVAAAGTGSHIGTHQSASFYGGRPWANTSGVLLSQGGDWIREVCVCEEKQMCYRAS
jgi:hypothetical protein